MRRSLRPGISLACAAAMVLAAPLPAYVFWSNPVSKGAPVKGDEPGIALPLPGATPKELRAGLLWSLRAGLNVAALQCQFEPGLRTVSNYNQVLRQHSVELQGAYTTLGLYFKRTLSEMPPSKTKPAAKAKIVKVAVPEKVWRGAAEVYNTRTYNSFSTMHAQFSFCDTAASIGRDALAVSAGDLGEFAALRMREFRNSLIPIADPRMAKNADELALDPITFPCLNKRGKIVKCAPPKS